MNDNKICSCVMAVVWITLDPDCYLSQTTSLFFFEGGGEGRVGWCERSEQNEMERKSGRKHHRWYLVQTFLISSLLARVSFSDYT